MVPEDIGKRPLRGTVAGSASPGSDLNSGGRTDSRATSSER